MNKFKVGDKVRRTGSTVFDLGMYKTGEYTIQEHHLEYGAVILKETLGWWADSDFELVATAHSTAGSQGTGGNAANPSAGIQASPTGTILPGQIFPIPGDVGASPSNFNFEAIDKACIEAFSGRDITGPVPTTRMSQCDCGGFKTFNTMSPEAHSHWCSSRK